MPIYHMDDGTLLNTRIARRSWHEGSYFDGRNLISRATESQWLHQTLYLSRKGRYYLVHHSDGQGAGAYAKWLDALAAARWLLRNGYELPEDLAGRGEEAAE